MLKYIAGLKSMITSLAGVSAMVGYGLKMAGVPGGDEVLAGSVAVIGYAAQDAHRAVQKEDLPQSDDPGLM